MRAITVRQPWAQAIATGRKLVENRGRRVTYRGEIAIHAAKAHDKAADRDPRIIDAFGPDPRLGMPTGAILAVAELVDCHLAADSCWTTGSCRPWGDRYYNGASAFHLVFDHVRRLGEPRYCNGALTIGWAVAEDVEEQVRADLAVQAGDACELCLGSPAVEVCCSSHCRAMCHRCYRKTHFVELCVPGCAACVAEGLGVRLGGAA